MEPQDNVHPNLYYFFFFLSVETLRQRRYLLTFIFELQWCVRVCSWFILSIQRLISSYFGVCVRPLVRIPICFFFLPWLSHSSRAPHSKALTWKTTPSKYDMRVIATKRLITSVMSTTDTSAFECNVHVLAAVKCYFGTERKPLRVWLLCQQSMCVCVWVEWSNCALLQSLLWPVPAASVDSFNINFVQQTNDHTLTVNE